MRFYSALILLFMTLLFVSCAGITVKGSGSVKEVSKELAPFHSLRLSGKGIIHFVQGSQHAMTIRAEENIMRVMKVEQNNEQINISYTRNFTTQNIPEFIVTLPDLRNVDIDGMARVTNEGTMNIQRLAVNISGKAKCDLDLKCETIELRLGGNAIVNLRGECETIRVSITGKADVAAQQLHAQRGIIRLIGQGNTELNVEEFLDVELNGAGSVTYLGSPELKTRINGSGTISAAKKTSAEKAVSDSSDRESLTEQEVPPVPADKPTESVIDGSGNGKEKTSGGSQ